MAVKSRKSRHVGAAGEFQVIQHLLELGHDVFQDVTGQARADLVVLIGNSLKRVQVKTTTVERKCSIAKANKRGSKWVEYQKKDVDIFALIFLDTKKVMYIPHRFFGSQKHVTIDPTDERFLKPH